MNRRRFTFAIFLSIALGLILGNHSTPARGGAYQPPPGIPAPSFGIDEVAPDKATYCPGWPASASAPCYYVDSTSGAATDTSNPYGYPDKPRLTIPTTLGEGSYVEIHGGPYAGGTIQINANGTAERPVWIRGADNGANMPVIRREIVPNGAYTIFENLKIDTVNSAFLSFRVKSGASSSHHMSVRYCVATGPGTAVSANSTFGATGDNTHQINNIVFYANTVSNYGDFGTILGTEQDWHAFAPSQYCDHIWVLNNTAHHVTGDGTQVGVATLPVAASVPYNIYVGGNDFHETGENCVDVKKSRDVVVSSNTGYGFRYSSHDPGGAIVMHNAFENLWVVNNTLHTAAYGINSSGGTGLRILGNLIYDIHHDSNAAAWNPASAYSDGAGIQVYNSATAEIANNTIWGSDTGVQTDSGTAYHLVNNLIGGRTQATGWDVAYGNSTVAAASTFNNNLFHNPSAVRIRWGNSTPYALAGFQANFGKCDRCLSADPQFGTGYSLLPTSPAINAGLAPPAFQDFFTAFGVDVSRDLAGNDRPVGNWDIGAFENPVQLRPKTPGNIEIN